MNMYLCIIAVVILFYTDTPTRRKPLSRILPISINSVITCVAVQLKEKKKKTDQQPQKSVDLLRENMVMASTQQQQPINLKIKF